MTDTVPITIPVLLSVLPALFLGACAAGIVKGFGFVSGAPSGAGRTAKLSGAGFGSGGLGCASAAAGGCIGAGAGDGAVVGFVSII